MTIRILLCCLVCLCNVAYATIAVSQVDDEAKRNRENEQALSLPPTLAVALLDDKSNDTVWISSHDLQLLQEIDKQSGKITKVVPTVSKLSRPYKAAELAICKLDGTPVSLDSFRKMISKPVPILFIEHRAFDPKNPYYKYCREDILVVRSTAKIHYPGEMILVEENQDKKTAG